MGMWLAGSQLRALTTQGGAQGVRLLPCPAVPCEVREGLLLGTAQLQPPQGPASPWQPQTACSFQRLRWQQEWCHGMVSSWRTMGRVKTVPDDHRCLLGTLPRTKPAGDGHREAGEGDIQTRNRNLWELIIYWPGSLLETAEDLGGKKKWGGGMGGTGHGDSTRSGDPRAARLRLLAVCGMLSLGTTEDLCP